MTYGNVAVIVPEMAIHQDLPLYSGGMGYLMGDYARSCRKLNMPAVFVSILWKQGYYDQHIEGRVMQVRYQSPDYSELCEHTNTRFSVPINGSQNWIEAWKVSEERFGVAPVYLLDADVEGNDCLGRMNTQQLYGEGSNPERRIAVSQILGAGAIEALKCLELPIAKFHLQESHTAFAAIEIFLSQFEKIGNVDAALTATRAQIVFTTHTPVTAGNPVYDMGLVMQMCGYGNRVDRTVIEMIGADPDRPQLFNMAAACMRLAGKTNGVSQKHGEIAHKMWKGITLSRPIGSVTNGVSQDFWQNPEYVYARTPREFEEVKHEFTKRGIRFVIERTRYRGGRYFNEDMLTLVWARRFAEYKRPKLLFRDEDWIAGLLKANKLQIIVAGKPHPEDGRMVGAFNDLMNLSYELPNLVVLPGYELEMSKVLKGMARVWLNTPRSPNEASGTSGMSAAMNGALNCSTPDGWMLEANPANCILFGARWPNNLESGVETEEILEVKRWQDAFDAQELVKAVNGLVRRFYEDREGFNRQAILGMRDAEKQFTSDRMALEYSAMYGNP